jgi:hypothetical protein
MRVLFLLVSICATMLALEARAQEIPAADLDLEEVFETLLQGDGTSQDRALARLDASWQIAYVPMLVEALRVSSNPDRYAIVELLEARTGQKIGGDINRWFEWIWQQRIVAHPRYADVKSVIYRRIDPRFAGYFSSSRETSIRLDEVRWGGVVQDGIPPLRQPTMLSAGEADYLSDGDVVFGIEVNGDVRAYPRRILAWHEMFTDKVGGIEVTGVY